MIVALPYGFSAIISLTLIFLSILLLINRNKNIMRQTIWDFMTKTCVIKLA
jgi:hypothetical protein